MMQASYKPATAELNTRTKLSSSKACSFSAYPNSHRKYKGYLHCGLDFKNNPQKQNLEISGLHKKATKI